MLKPKKRIKIPNFYNQVYLGDCLGLLKKLPDASIELIVTSPPYTNQRKRTYEGVSPDKYVEWFTPISEELKRVLKPNGSFILNIKENAINGERHTYVIELILKMKSQGWLWTEEYIWNKKNSFPGKWPNRFRDSYERCLHFNKQKSFYMNQDAVMVPVGDWKKKRFQYIKENDLIRNKSAVGNNFSKNIANWSERDMAYPTNVLTLATECSNMGHSAAFPEELPSWFIKLFSKEDDVVLDPFLGSGTTAVACYKLGRRFIGIELSEEYAKLSCERISKIKKKLNK